MREAQPVFFFVVVAVCACGTSLKNYQQEDIKQARSLIPKDQQRRIAFNVDSGAVRYGVGFSEKGLRVVKEDGVHVLEDSLPVSPCDGQEDSRTTISFTPTFFHREDKCHDGEDFLESEITCHLKLKKFYLPVFLLVCDHEFSGGAHPDSTRYGRFYYVDDFSEVRCDVSNLVEGNTKLKDMIRKKAIEVEPACNKWDFDDIASLCQAILLKDENTAEIQIQTYLPRDERGMPCDQMQYSVTVSLDMIQEATAVQLLHRKKISSRVSVTPVPDTGKTKD